MKRPPKTSRGTEMQTLVYLRTLELCGGGLAGPGPGLALGGIC